MDEAASRCHAGRADRCRCVRAPSRYLTPMRSATCSRGSFHEGDLGGEHGGGGVLRPLSSGAGGCPSSSRSCWRAPGNSARARIGSYRAPIVRADDRTIGLRPGVLDRRTLLTPPPPPPPPREGRNSGFGGPSGGSTFASPRVTGECYHGRRTPCPPCTHWHRGFSDHDRAPLHVRGDRARDRGHASPDRSSHLRPAGCRQLVDLEQTVFHTLAASMIEFQATGGGVALDQRIEAELVDRHFAPDSGARFSSRRHRLR